MSATVGLDLGGTNIVGALVDGREIIREIKVSTPKGGVSKVVEALLDAVEAVTEGVPTPVGLGTPGVVEPGTGRVLRAPNLAGFEEPVPLQDRLEGALGVPVVVANDVNVAAYGEATVGAARGVRDVLAIWMGTGLGAGLILDGVLRVGPSGLAGELGHAVVVPNGRPCPCGGFGHLEAYAGRRALEERARTLHAGGHTTKLVELAKGKRMKSKTFAQALAADDAVANELIDEAIEMLGIAVSNVSVTVDVSTVVIGGGLGDRLGDRVTDGLGRALRRHRFAGTPPHVVPSALGDHAGVIGAASLAALSLATESRAADR